MNNFWKKLKNPITCLAPMDDVTDIIFREILTKTYKPDVFFTEFTNVEALNSEGKESEIRRLKYSRNQKPIVAQVWGLIPENYFKSAKMIREIGFDGIDINMGCPQRAVVKNKACSALIENKSLAEEIILATKEATNLPLSIKTRIGFKKAVTEDWVSFLLNFNLNCLIIHGRTQKEMSGVPCHWDEIEKAVKVRNEMKKDTLIIGNGDLKNYKDIQNVCSKYNVDGGMIGRGIFTDMYAFDPNNYAKAISKDKQINLLKEHLNLWEKEYKDTRNYSVMKKFFKIYIRDFDGSKEMRIKLMSTNSVDEAIKEIQNVEK